MVWMAQVLCRSTTQGFTGHFRLLPFMGTLAKTTRMPVVPAFEVDSFWTAAKFLAMPTCGSLAYTPQKPCLRVLCAPVCGCGGPAFSVKCPPPAFCYAVLW